MKPIISRSNKLTSLFVLILLSCFIIAGCSKPASQKPRIVATTTMLGDMAQVLAQDDAEVITLMGPGVDPHLYTASAQDMNRLKDATIVLYSGLHLEGKMGDIFAQLSKQGKTVICASDGIPDEKLLGWDQGGHDPHVWFDVTLWKDATRHVATQLAQADPAHADAYQKRAEAYLAQLDELDTYARERITSIPDSSRYLITAHDAFQYFGRAYGIEVRGLQGISTETEAGTKDMSDLATFIADHHIKAIFVESSVPHKSVEALQAAVQARGADVAVGGELYSDSLGDGDHASYLATVRANVDTIVGALS